MENARTSGNTVIHIQHIIPSKDAPFFGEGTEGGKNNQSVTPATGETILQKLRPNSFHGTVLRQTLDDAGISNITICGAMSQMCIDATTRAAADFGYSVTLVADACGAKDLTFGDTTVPAPLVHAAFMAPWFGLCQGGFNRTLPKQILLGRLQTARDLSPMARSRNVAISSGNHEFP